MNIYVFIVRNSFYFFAYKISSHVRDDILLPIIIQQILFLFFPDAWRPQVRVKCDVPSDQ